ncbi:MAG: UbiD family decarboxylase [Rhodospirillaceae bacterium]|jgi:UbiD family decarboxylase|nr:UbiD family decarboxylase [Rhodospirillaceae bacterium]MBT5457822.1 UbiD family decarboxylase [Rhodospirillaceae bacterium]
MADPAPVRDHNFQHALNYEDLRDWLAEADRLGELREVKGASWEQEIGLACTLMKYDENSPALLFDDIPGVRPGFRVLANFFGGTRKNMTLGFPTHLSKVGLSEAWATAYSHDTQALIPPVDVEDGPIFENILLGDDVDIEQFPAPIWHDGDGGRYIGTGSYNVTRDPDTDWLNMGTYRIMVKDARTVSFNTGFGKHGRMHFDKYTERGEKTPVVMVIGGDPLAFIMGGYEVPSDISEFDVLGGLRGRPVELVRGKVTGLPFPANAEIVLEGYVDPDVEVPEGPFGDWCGSYTESGRMRPKCDVVAVYHRNDPIILGFPPQHLPDEYSRFRAITRSTLLKRAVERTGVPDVKQVWCHEVGGSHMLTGISITQRYPGHATQAAQIASQCQSGAYAGKWVIVVDDDVDVVDLEELIWAALMRCDPVKDIDFIKYGWTSFADPRIEPEDRASGNITNSRMIIDACRPFHWRDDFNKSTKPDDALLDMAREKFGYLLE